MFPTTLRLISQVRLISRGCQWIAVALSQSSTLGYASSLRTSTETPSLTKTDLPKVTQLPTATLFHYRRYSSRPPWAPNPFSQEAHAALIKEYLELDEGIPAKKICVEHTKTQDNVSNLLKEQQLDCLAAAQRIIDAMKPLRTARSSTLATKMGALTNQYVTAESTGNLLAAAEIEVLMTEISHLLSARQNNCIEPAI